ncbi:HNH endonuclease signature motif containing protein [Streptomyces hydrogenans]|uniref:HNH endonuclease signature motif containing protein n=1 Tax=Streptomyces hydrogenans TaxID=1873719 RepID=UPI0035D69A13
MDLSDGKVRRRVNKALRERGVPAKACGKCFSIKSLAQFSARGRSADGRQAQCSPCATITRTDWRVANPEIARQRSQERNRRWREANPERARECSRESKRRWREADPRRNRESVRRWREVHPETAREHNRASTHRRRAREAAATIEPFTPADLRADWEEHDLWDCFFCGGPLEDLHIDHFYPLTPADEEKPPGPHAVFNLVPSCAECNLSKSNGDPWSFLRESLAARGIDLDAALRLFDVD